MVVVLPQGEWEQERKFKGKSGLFMVEGRLVRSEIIKGAHYV